MAVVKDLSPGRDYKRLYTSCTAQGPAHMPPVKREGVGKLNLNLTSQAAIYYG